MSSSIMSFESLMYVSDEMNKKLLSLSCDLAMRSVKACAEHYNFDGDEAIRLLGLGSVSITRQSKSGVGAGACVGAGAGDGKDKVVAVEKPSFPMPYNGECNDSCCNALRQNNGLYTQCQSVKKEGDFCKQCQVLADKNEGIPEYGTIQMRKAVDIFEYIDPKGRKPASYTKVMKKFKVDQEKVLEEAEKFNININLKHFDISEMDTKRGRPSIIKAPKEVKGSKGRPKKEKKILQVNGVDDDDLFAALVADANNAAGEEVVVIPPPKTEPIEVEKTDVEILAEKASADILKAEKEAKLAAQKAEKEAKIVAQKAEKEAKLAAQQAEKEAKLAADKAEKEKSTTQKKPVVADVVKVDEDVEEEVVVKKILFEGKKYLKSKNAGIIYDYDVYVKTGDQVVLGQWNEKTNKIDFKVNNDNDEEEEEDYDDDDDEEE